MSNRPDLIGLSQLIKIQFFFHQYAYQRRHSNTIRRLENRKGNFTENVGRCRRLQKSFFMNLFRSQEGSGDTGHILSGINRCISREDNDFVTASYKIDEVLSVLKEMRPLKAPGCDGFSAFFYQQCCHIVGKEVNECCL